MTTKQVRFKTTDGPRQFGGVYVRDGSREYVICGCCGGVFQMDEIKEFEELDDWVNFSKFIL